jgi:hypothetical protein
MYLKILLMTAVLVSGQVFAQTATPVAKKKKKVTATAAATAAPVAEVKKEEVKKEEAAVVTTPSSVPSQAFSYMKEHFSASYHGEYYAVRRDVYDTDKNLHDIQDLNIMHNPTIIYKPMKNWQVLLTAEFKYSDAPPANAGTFNNDYHRALATITKKKILEESESGFQLDAGIGRRDMNTRTNPTAYGNDRVFTTLTKNFGKNNGSLFVQYLFNDYKTASAATWKHSLELIPTVNIQLTEKLSYMFNDDIIFNTPKYDNTARDISMSHEMNLAFLNYQFTDKISSYYQFKYYHTEKFTDGSQDKDDYLEHYVGVAYAFTPKATATFEIGSELFHARDGKDFFSKKVSYPELALYLDFAL